MRGEPSYRAVFASSDAELRELTARMPNARRTGYGSCNVQTRVRKRARQATFVVSDDPVPGGGRAVGRLEGERIAAAQDRYLRDHDVVVVDGFIGHAGPHRVAVRLMVERAHASIAAMQRHLWFGPVQGAAQAAAPPAPEVPEVTVICTPGLRLPGAAPLIPDGAAVAVWPNEGVTRIVGSDFFGEAKKAGIRMWSERVHAAGGVVLHAACKVVPTPAGPRTMLLCGQQGTGKTALTFRCDDGSRIVQDDFVALLPGGKVVASEAGCIEKTLGLDPRATPLLHAAATRPDTYLENTPQRGAWPDFADPAHPEGRAVFPLRSIGDCSLPADTIPPVSFLLILNRHDDVVPAVARLDPTQASAAASAADAFLLRELRAGEPVWTPPAASHAQLRQRDRLAELLAGHPAETFVLNTGRIGGPATDDRSKPVRLEHTEAVVRAIAAGAITWEPNARSGPGPVPGLGHAWQLATEGCGVDDLELLRPQWLYQRQDRRREYREACARLAAENAAFLVGNDNV